MEMNGVKPIFTRQELRKETLITAQERTVRESWGLHWHDFIELELIIDGKGTQILNGKCFPLSRGRLSLLRMTDYHSLQNDGIFKLLHLGFDESVLPEEMLARIAAGDLVCFELEEQETQIFESLFRLCISENTAPTPDRKYLKHLIYCIFLRILKQMRETTLPIPEASSPIHSALLYMRMHFKENPKLEDVAKVAHYNKSHFSTTFRKEIGITYSEYINKLKIDYAKELLLSTALRVSDICFECGFASHANFLRLFKANTGMSPLQFRVYNK